MGIRPIWQWNRTQLFLCSFFSFSPFFRTLHSLHKWHSKRWKNGNATRLVVIWMFYYHFSYLDEVDSRCGNVFARRIRLKQLDSRYRRPRAHNVRRTITTATHENRNFCTYANVFPPIYTAATRANIPMILRVVFFLFRLLLFGVLCMPSDAQCTRALRKIIIFSMKIHTINM